MDDMEASGKATGHVAAPMTTDEPRGKTGWAQLGLLLAIVYVALNLRPALVGVGPVVDSIRAGLGLSATALGVLITLPVLCFGVFAPFAPRLLRWQPAERIIFISLFVLAAGIALRSHYGAAGLFTGTFLLGLAISIVMVLLPALIKRHFAARASLMMGVYSTALAGGAAVAAGVTVPLEQAFDHDWRFALAFWAVPAVLAIVVWLPQLRGLTQLDVQQQAQAPRLRNNWLAWQVTLFMGLQGAIAYCIFGWLPLMLIERGLSARDAGYVVATFMVLQLLTSITAPWLATRGRDQRPAIAVFMGLVLIGYLGMVMAPISAVYVWGMVFGLGLGGMFSVAMALLVLRSPSPQMAAALSGMAQGVGYFIAALAPLVVGVLREYTGGWGAVSVFMVTLILGAMWSGLLAGRDRLIQ